MAVQVQCVACGTRFSAPDSLVGKRVRCKKCGAAFTVSADGADASTGFAREVQPVDPSIGTALPQDVLPAAQAEKQAVKSAFKQLREREQKITSFGTEGPDVDMDSLLEGDGTSGDGGPDGLGTMRQMWQFDYPYSAQVDRFLPGGLLVISLAIVAMQSFSQETHGVGWIAPLRIFLLVLSFVAIVFPVTFQGLKGAIHKAGLGMPWNPRIKALGAMAVPVALGYVLWTVGESIPALVIGLVVGLVVALAAIWLLYRLRPEQLLKPMVATGIWFIIASAMACGFLFGVNLTVQSIVAGGGSSDLVVSPVAPHLPWNSPEKPIAQKPSAPKPPATTPKPTTKPADGVSNPKPPTIANGTASNPTPGTGLPIESNPPKPAAGDGSTHAPPETVVENPPSIPKPPEELPGPPEVIPDQPVVENNGNNLTPPEPLPTEPVTPLTPEVQVAWSDLVTGAVPVAEAQNFDQLIAPLTASRSRLLVRRNAAGDDELELWTTGNPWARLGQTTIKKDSKMPGTYALTPTSGQMVRLVSWPALAVQVWSFKESQVFSNVELNSNNGTPELIGCISDQQALVFWTSGERHALQLVNLTSGAGQALPGWMLPGVQTAANNLVLMPDGKSMLMTGLANDGPRVMQIQIPTGKVIESFRIPMLDPKWGVKPAALSLSPDGKTLAAMFSKDQNVLILQWQMPKGTPIGSPLTFLAGMLNEPPAGYCGDAIGWIGSRSMLINGRDVINADTGEIEKPLCDVPVMGMIPASPQELEVIFPGIGGKSRLMNVQLSQPTTPVPAAP